MRTLRLFSILDLLRSKRQAVSAESLAQSLNVSVRTIYRDMATLQDMGAPIRGEGGIGYQIEKGYFLPPMHFDPDELDALILGMRLVSARGDKSLSEAALRALGKINAVLADRHLDSFDKPLRAYSSQSYNKESLDFLSTLRLAIRQRNKLQMDYLDLSERASKRLVRPLGLTVFDKAWLLTAWCESRDDFRNFRVDRIQAVELQPGVFARERGKEFKDFLCTMEKDE
ncbi:MAG: DNA-binding transcriptional regulator [SAR86 cluster bacterium]|uniref:DNA-binding transcriptional regulator n=1 Tax=SAR86 cluster bacterium TaxID=2030880 RepID=A0A2A4MNY8_9GAMM|nr:MAG: DNA-binding transcriptional regulator [SAR86 cluster bacterium]